MSNQNNDRNNDQNNQNNNRFDKIDDFFLNRIFNQYVKNTKKKSGIFREPEKKNLSVSEFIDTLDDNEKNDPDIIVETKKIKSTENLYLMMTDLKEKIENSIQRHKIRDEILHEDLHLKEQNLSNNYSCIDDILTFQNDIVKNNKTINSLMGQLEYIKGSLSLMALDNVESQINIFTDSTKDINMKVFNCNNEIKEINAQFDKLKNIRELLLKKIRDKTNEILENN